MLKLRKRLDVTAEADMTPMIDMTFQLIAFFMVLLNFTEAEQDQRIRLPSSELAKPPDTPLESPLTLQLTDDGMVLLASGNVPVAEMSTPLARESEFLRRQGKSPADASVIIRADASAKTGLVQQLIQKAQEAGFETFALRVKQETARP